MKKLTLAGIWLVSVILSAAVASSFVSRYEFSVFKVQLDETQAMLAFNHMARYRELESDLSKGCQAEALEKARISVDREMHLISSIYKENEDTSVNKYIADRSPELLNELKSFKSKYGSSWSEPQCTK